MSAVAVPPGVGQAFGAPGVGEGGRRNTPVRKNDAVRPSQGDILYDAAREPRRPHLESDWLVPALVVPGA